MPTKLKRGKAAKSAKLTLPTLAAFKALSLRRRTRVFLNWVKTKPVRETYNPGSTSECAICQFARALGISNPHADADSFRETSLVP